MIKTAKRVDKSTESSIIVDGIPIVLTRKKVKNINMRIKPDGEVRVSAPRLMPESVIREFVHSRRDWILRGIETVNNRAELGEIPEEERPSRKRELDAKLKERLPYWESRMGLHSSGYRIKYMKSRWGSCNYRTGMLSFNLRLVLFDDSCLDYVIVHELAHIQEANHGPAFWHIVEQYIPDYKSIRAKMR